ncbi:sodium:proton antiporter [Leptolyngbya iicbica LK]|uniref:Sodium:proton antiporter n=3 Tax=Cyanophyceae TaxID=3028117 RepID=A0A4Q7E1G2_9CYAN|nr:sodium:proton antiporter [Leptolyngbya sp. LK]
MSLLTDATDLAIERNLKEFLPVLLVALSAASLPRIFPFLRQVPYTLLLVIVGLGLALVEVRLIDLSPGMILLIFLPPILFEAAWKMRWPDLQRELLPSSLFAIGSVPITVAGVGWALHQWMQVSWTTALLTGACLAATDSASVLGVFREVGAGKRLTTLLEGESLFNDGAAVVAFSVLLEQAVDPQPIDLSTTLLQFVVVSAIGLGVGGVIGTIVALLTQRYDLAWVEQTLSLVTAYGGYILAEDLGGSGVIGVVTAGLIIGNLSLVPGEQPQKCSTMIEFWEFIIFLVNSIVFLLLGDQILFPYFLENIDTSLVAIAAVLVSRGVAIYGFSAISGWVTQNPIPWAEQTVLWWVGLRGSVAIALALSIPDGVPDRQQIISNSFGVVLFTLLIQGLTSKFLLDRLNLLTDEKLYQQYLTLVAQRDALQKILTYLLDGDRKPVIAADKFQQELAFVKTTLTETQNQLAAMREAHPLLEGLILQQHQAQLVAIETLTYTNFVQQGLLKEIPPSVIERAISHPS